MSARPPIRVLIVDDSAVVRRILAAALGQHADIDVVASARDPYEARERIVEFAPDVITLDIEMPRMDGLTFLEKLMRAQPSRVVVVSSVAAASSANAVRALALGAAEVVLKPQDAASLPDVAQQLVRAIRNAAAIPLASLASLALVESASARAPHRDPEQVGGASSRLVAIGASTGGPRAIEQVLSRLPAGSPGTLIVQHMPARFTTAFAARLDTVCSMRVREAVHGELVRDGVAYVAPGGLHLRVQREPQGYVIQLKDAPPVHHQRPAVDVLFDSVAAAAGSAAVGVLLTGMGADGARGLLAMREAGAHTMAQDEETSAVFGMPREAVAMGAAAQVLPLVEIAVAITHAVSDFQPEHAGAAGVAP